MNRAILIPFHCYTPYGKSFYEPILDFFLSLMKKYKDEYDMLYLLDSNWEIDKSKLGNLNAKVIKVNPSLRYYDVYRQIISTIKEDLTLFLDNDFLIYKKGVIDSAFKKLEEERYDVVSITDTIGTMKVPLKTGNKLCPYFFATRKDLLMKYLDVDWGPNMPYTETFGLLTKALLKDGNKVYEMEDDKSSIYFDGTEIYPNGTGKSKNLGYMHIRSGSVPSVLLAWKYYDKKQYWIYLKNQPRVEYLRQLFWYQYMGGNPYKITTDIEITKEIEIWDNYYNKCLDYYGLSED